MGCAYSRRRCRLLLGAVSLPRSGRVLHMHLVQPVYSYIQSVAGLGCLPGSLGYTVRGPKQTWWSARKLAPWCCNLCAAQPPAASGQVRRSQGATSFPPLWGSEGSPCRKRERIWGCHSSLPVLPTCCRKVTDK